MTFAAQWKQEARDGQARRGVLALTHGRVETPGFMPVGTRGTVKGLDSDDLRAVGTQMVLANTYHLMLRPGAELVEALGGLHGFMGWQEPILTDSGGFQIYSLGPKIDEDGAVFRSTYDGSEVALTPEKAVKIQEQLGADIAMVLDVCVGLPAPLETVRLGAELSMRWAERSTQAHTRSDQALFGIVQGGTDARLREWSALRTAELGFAGFGIGGLSVGEPAAERNAALETVLGVLPPDNVRYVMGLGDAEGVLDAVARGADLFDCVWPTRLARHGRVLSWEGDYNLRRAEHRDDIRPLSESCRCITCGKYSRAYLRHLLAMSELAVFRLVSIHNLTFTLSLLARARQAIKEGRFEDYAAEVSDGRRNGRSSEHD